jgi:hypothetical protein
VEECNLSLKTSILHAILNIFLTSRVIFHKFLNFNENISKLQEIFGYFYAYEKKKQYFYTTLIPTRYKLNLIWEYDLLGHNAVYLRKSLIFHRNILRSYSGSASGPSKKPARAGGKQSFVYFSSWRWRQYIQIHHWCEIFYKSILPYVCVTIDGFWIDD